MKMRVMIDGKEIRVEYDVRILFEDLDIPATLSGDVDLHVILRHDGLTVDLIGPEHNAERPIVGSCWRTLEDLIELTTGEAE